MNRNASRSGTGEPSVCVIVPTVASTERTAYIVRALDSIGTQTGVRTQTILVANGPQCDPQLLAQLRSRDNTTVIRQEQASLSAALCTGRHAVDSEFFAELDDDDYLLPGALAHRLSLLQANPRADALISNGFVRSGDAEWRSIGDVAGAQRDSMSALLQMNWMLPGSALFRTSAIPAGLFADMPKYLEWTSLGLQLARRHELCFDHQPTFVHVEDHPFSIDRSADCMIGRARAIKELLHLDLPPDVRKRLQTRLSAANHAAANFFLSHNQPGKAWAAHLRSLRGRNGLRYLSFTRHLIAILLGREHRQTAFGTIKKLEQIDDITH